MTELTNEDYYSHDTNTDTWSIIFPNRKALSKSEIDTIFSKFGTIKRIVQTGNETGLCIIKFDSKEAAVECISAAPEARNFIKLRKFGAERPENKSRKIENFNPQKEFNKTPASDRLRRFAVENLEEKDSSKENDNSAVNKLNKNVFRAEQTDLIKSINELMENQSIGVDSEQNSPQNDEKSMKNQSFGVHFEQNCPKNPLKSIKIDKITRTKFLTPPRMPNFTQQNGKEKKTFVFDDQKEKIELNNSTFSAVLHQKDEIEDKKTFLEGKEMSSLSLDASGLPEGLPELINTKRTPEIPNHPLCNGPCCRECPAPPGVHEIVVANIDDACDVGFILKLFKDFDPLYVSSMKVHPEKNFRYCHVYFKSPESAEGVEKAFDRLRVYGKDLIVLRPESFPAHV